MLLLTPYGRSAAIILTNLGNLRSFQHCIKFGVRIGRRTSVYILVGPEFGVDFHKPDTIVLIYIVIHGLYFIHGHTPTPIVIYALLSLFIISEPVYETQP